MIHPARQKIEGVSEMKFMLILGIVLIHSNLSGNYSISTVNENIGLKIIDWISGYVCHGCVPSFFIISAYLFFNGMVRFTPSIYAEKLKRRAHSLLIPYLLWCSFCAILLFVKHLHLNASGLGIFLDNGTINWVNFIKGYWAIESLGNMPYAFAFWFIRNLIVFIIISPLAWLIGRHRWLTVIMFAIILIFDIDLYGFEWFVAGTFLATNGINIPSISTKQAIFIIGTFLVSSILLWYCSPRLFPIIGFIQVLFTILTVCYFSGKIKTIRSLKPLIASTFMIYAVHQCFCTRMRIIWENIWGVESVFCALLAYTCCFLSLVLISFIAYLILKRFSPRFLALITGGR